jgi:purine-binding chemotaxis protein CheW
MQAEKVNDTEHNENASKQFATFYLGDRLYGIDVMQVQEVTQALAVTPIRLAPPYVKGLINLRGQIATAIGLRELFALPSISESQSSASVVCRVEGNLLSLLVDRIGDVMEVQESSFEPTPDIIDSSVSNFMKGVYKTEGPILSVIEIDFLSRELNSREQKPKLDEQIRREV